ncbi:MAG: STAS domain-containing protein [Planctomycetota bacterium]|jgi:anti-anti-sigma factor
MGIENLSEGVVVVTLPVESQIIVRELKLVNEMVSNRDDCDVVIDFSNVEVLTSSGISNLMILRELLRESGRQLILCSVSTATMGIFTVAGLEEVFEFADDRPAALKSVQCTNQPASPHTNPAK